MNDEMAELEAMLRRLRALRDTHPWGEVRQAYNAAADRIDVVWSKLYQGQRQPAFRIRGFWQRVWNR